MKFIDVESLFVSGLAVQVVTLARPEVKNAFHPEMIAEITAYFKSESANSSDMVVLKGSGTVFCAGADLGWMQSMVNYSYDENIKDSIKLWDMFAAIKNCQAPVIGLAHGAVFGGALGLLAACDYVYAEEKTQFCFSEVKLGLAPAVIADFISQKIQDAFIRPLMLSAEVFTSAHALHLGLVHQVYQGAINTENAVKTFAAHGTHAMKATKKLLNQLSVEVETLQRRDLCALTITERRMSTEGQSRLRAFLDRPVKGEKK